MVNDGSPLRYSVNTCLKDSAGGCTSVCINFESIQSFQSSGIVDFRIWVKDKLEWPHLESMVSACSQRAAISCYLAPMELQASPTSLSSAWRWANSPGTPLSLDCLNGVINACPHSQNYLEDVPPLFTPIRFILFPNYDSLGSMLRSGCLPAELLRWISSLNCLKASDRFESVCYYTLRCLNLCLCKSGEKVIN